MSIGTNIANELQTNNSDLEVGKIVYRKVPSLQFLYEISSDGRIFRNVKSKKQLYIGINNQGYRMVSGSIKGKHFYRTVHSLVAECWLGEKPNGYEIDHIDRNKDNNDYRNLRYVTHSENNLNRVKRGQVPVTIIHNGKVVSFCTMKQGAEYITQYVSQTYKAVRWRMSKRRKHILGFDIVYHKTIYPTVETASSRSTEQGTVRTSKD